jgi:Tfp pilus assembly protein PilN
VRAVNLIPADQRRGAGGIAGRSGGIVYVLPAGLAVLVLLGVIYALAVHQVADKKGQLAAVTQQVASVNEQAQALAPYVQFAGVSAVEVSQVKTLAGSRFDWPDAMRQLALALPPDVTFTSFNATANQGPANADGSTDTTFTLTGCASTQGEIANVLTNLAGVPGVDDVTLTSTAENLKQTKSGKSQVTSAEASGGACPFVTFAVDVAYSSAYTIPLQKTGGGASPGQTVSAAPSSPTISTAATQQSTGATQ